jgi:Fe2+ or Zn2+ uptake regulation protein
MNRTMIGPSPASRRRQSLAGALLCTRCGSRVALDRSALDLARADLVRSLGFLPERGELELSGCCAACHAEGLGTTSGWGRA